MPPVQSRRSPTLRPARQVPGLFSICGSFLDSPIRKARHRRAPGRDTSTTQKQIIAIQCVACGLSCSGHLCSQSDVWAIPSACPAKLCHARLLYQLTIQTSAWHVAGCLDRVPIRKRSYMNGCWLIRFIAAFTPSRQCRRASETQDFACASQQTFDLPVNLAIARVRGFIKGACARAQAPCGIHNSNAAPNAMRYQANRVKRWLRM